MIHKDPLVSLLMSDLRDSSALEEVREPGKVGLGPWQLIW